MRRPLARLALTLASTAFALALGEGFWRWRRAHAPPPQDDAAWRERIQRMNRTIYRRSSDPELVYEPVPGASVEMPYGAAGFNAAGMRDDREHARAPDARPRVTLLGDSLAWSEEVAVADSLPRALERELGGAQRVEVLPFGVSGYDTAQEVRWYERAARPFGARVVVLVYCMNDAMLMSGPYNRFATPEEAARKDAQDALWDRLAPVRAETLDAVAEREESSARFTLLAHLRWRLRASLYESAPAYQDEYLLSHAQPDRAARVRSALARLGADLREDGARGLLVLSPVLRSWPRYHWSALHAQVARWAREAGLLVADPWPEWQRSERAERLRLPGDSLHYGPRGNAVFGGFIARALRSRGLLEAAP